MLECKVIWVRCISCSYNNVAKGICLLDKKQFLYIHVRAFERYIPLKKSITQMAYFTKTWRYWHISINGHKKDIFDWEYHQFSVELHVLYTAIQLWTTWIIMVWQYWSNMFRLRMIIDLNLSIWTPHVIFVYNQTAPSLSVTGSAENSVPYLHGWKFSILIPNSGFWGWLSIESQPQNA